MERYSLSLRGFFFLGTKACTFISYDKYVILLCLAGTAPNIARNAIVNCTELVTYDFIKDTLLKSTPLTGKTMSAVHHAEA